MAGSILSATGGFYPFLAVFPGFDSFFGAPLAFEGFIGGLVEAGAFVEEFTEVACALDDDAALVVDCLD